MWKLISRRAFVTKTLRLVGGTIFLGIGLDRAFSQPVPLQKPGLSPASPLPLGSVPRPVPAGERRPGLFMLIDGIEGDSDDAHHKKWINLASFSSPAGLGGSVSPGARAGPQVLRRNEISWRAKRGKASTQLAEAKTKETFHKSAVIEGFRQHADGTSSLRITMTNVQVGAIGPGPDPQSEEGALRYERIRLAFVRRGPDGKILGLPLLLSN